MEEAKKEKKEKKYVYSSDCIFDRGDRTTDPLVRLTDFLILLARLARFICTTVLIYLLYGDYIVARLADYPSDHYRLVPLISLASFVRSRLILLV